MLEQTPEDGMAWFYAAVHAKIDGHVTRALECCNECLQLLPDYGPAKFLRAQCLLEDRQFAAAEQHLLEMISVSPREESLWVHLLLAMARGGAGPDGIARCIERAEAGGHATAFLYETAAAELIEMRKPVKAQIYRKRARELKKK
jgi:tetratricopeptide (TPR) repeat protein